MPIWKWVSQYFPARLVVSEELRDWSKENNQDGGENKESIQLPPAYNYLLGYHPHGAYTIGAILAYATEALNFSKTFPGITPYLSTTDGLFNIPFFRDYTLLFGIVSVSRKSLLYLLDKDTTGKAGKLVVVTVGGAREMLEARPGRYVFVLNRRRGFFRMALETGSHLVPSIGFGETNLYDQVANPEGSRIRRLQDWLIDRFAITLALFHSTRFIPYRRPLTVVGKSSVGRPIACQRITNPTNEDVNRLMEKYKQQLVQLFNKYRPLYDPAAEDIRFI
ncbi:hypothetical protein Aperf_G00000093217 [Anoplocephala perfoliata]